MGLISFINVAIDRIRASRERGEGKRGAQRDWRKSEGRGKKEMRSQSKYNKCGTTGKDLPYGKLVISSMNQHIKGFNRKSSLNPVKI